MKTVFKYVLKVTDEQTIQMPLGAKVLSVQNQQDKPCLWALVDPEHPSTESVSVAMFGTGNPIEDWQLEGLSFLGTVQINWLVLHVFVQSGFIIDK